MQTKKIVLAASAITVLGLSSLTALHANRAYAAPNSSSLIDRLVQRFNLNRDDVQAVMNEHHAEIMEGHEQGMKNRLAQIVKDGKITQAQADLITAKHAELKTFMESMEDKTMEERREAMKTKMDELKKWAQDNNIPSQYLRMGMKGPHGKPEPRNGASFRHFGK